METKGICTLWRVFSPKMQFATENGSFAVLDTRMWKIKGLMKAQFSTRMPAQ